MEHQIAQRQTAQSDIDFFLTQHGLHAYRSAPKPVFEERSKWLAKQLGIVHGGDVEKIVESLLEYAAKIEKFELHDMWPNGHHERAAAAIRRLAESISLDTCPWRDLNHGLAKRPVLRDISKVLWRENRRFALQWSVDLATLAEGVWGDPLTAEGTIRSQISRFASWLLDHGVSIDIAVKASQNPLRVDCQVLSVDEAKIESFGVSKQTEERKLKIQAKALIAGAANRNSTGSMIELAKKISLDGAR